ncbi:Uncharacterised protein [Psychrobacter phenylpyruvicus]|uniref:Uncharacterized protein n=1 Tax=Psychrobacter phenylpyruvicus TaxID=29432 RepID=A0A379LIW4_9GAMM|nr:Uncharacterised protein [Psychrobacter phenylpyruvicus]
MVSYLYADTSSNNVYEFYLDDRELKTKFLEGN